MPTPAARRIAPALVIAGVLLAAPVAGAAPGVAAAERRAVRQEERRVVREARHHEAEARRRTREEQRSARHLARREHLAARAGEEPAASPGAASGECVLSLAAASPRVLVGETVSLSGAVTCPAAAPASAARVDIYQRSGAARPQARTLTQTPRISAGAFTATSGPLSADTVFVARLGREHARVTVQVAPAVTLTAAPAPTAAGSAASRTPRTRITFSGAVSPAAPGELVALQVSHAVTGERWRSIGWTHTAADGSYTLEHVLRTPGVTAVRTIVHAGGHLGVGVSEPLSLQGSQPQHVALTIAASADPIVAGQPVVISGTAAGGADVPVKLLARTPGGSFAVAAEGVTDEHGDYSFEQTPSEVTVYRVTDGEATSTGLQEEVAPALALAPAPATAKVSEPVTFAGTLTPAAAGLPLVLERRTRSGTSFVPIASGAVGAPPDWSIAFAFERAGEYVLRVRAPGDGRLRGTTSAPFVLDVSG